MAANLAVDWGNKHVFEAANDDKQLAERIDRLEKMRDEHDISYSAGFGGKPLPEIAKGDAQLLGYYKEGLEHFKTDLAIADHEGGLAIGGWSSASEYWTEEDSEAAWARFDQLRADLLEAEASLARAVENPGVETSAPDLSNVAAGDSVSDDTARFDHSTGQTAEAIYQASARENAVARHGETAVATGEDLLERLVKAGREMRDSETRVGRHREGDEEREAGFEKLVQATANYNQILRQAAREAVDGNGFIREARWHRDLETAITFEDLRHEQRAQFYVQNEELRSGQSDLAERPFQANDTGRPEAPQQHMTRLRQIEQEIEERGRTDRDERDR